jgi:NAD nucleotidase
MKKLFVLGLVIALSITSMAKPAKKASSSKGKGLEINIIHVNDHHSHLEEEKMDLVLDGKKTTVHIGGFPRINQRIQELMKTGKNNLVLHAGDALSGTLYYTLFKGKADAALMNAGKFDLFTLGNHEFDDGNKVLKSFLDELKIPVVSANVVPDKGSILEGKWVPYIIKKIGGQDVALVGLDVVGKTVRSSSPGPDIKFLDEVETAKKVVEELQAKGINKIIFISHAGYEKNLEIAEKVSGIDVIITGDTHYLLGESFKEYGLKPIAEYPKKIMSPAGEPVYVAEAWSYSYLVGNLKAKFDDKGVITELIPNPTIIIGDDLFERKNEKGKTYKLEGKEKQDVIKYVNSRKDIKFVKEEPDSKKVLERYKAEKNELGKKMIGKIKDEIPGGSANRIPNDKNPQGSIATRLVSETVLAKLKKMGTGQIDLVILNSGGIRMNLEPGDFSYDNAYTLLPFTSNTIYILKMSGAEIKQVIEDALDFALSGGSSGAFPYGAGVRFEATKAGKLGTRVKKIEVFDAKAKKWVPMDMKKMYEVGTNSYVAKGKDGYTTFGKVNSERPGVDTHLGVETAFIEYLKEKGEIAKPDSSNVIFKY